MDWLDDIGDDALQVKVAEMLVATADEADYLIDGSVPEVLRLLRERMKMDVVFVSEFTNGERVFRCVDEAPGQPLLSVGASDPLEESWCQRVVDGRMPELVADVPAAQRRGEVPNHAIAIGTHLSTPIVLDDGEVYGTLCCFSFGVNPGVTQQDVRTLRYTAQLTAQKIDKARRRKAELELVPIPADPFTKL
jgi:GAF domain-containing protein